MPVPAGGEAVYTLKVTNDGPSDTTGVTVTDTLDGNLEFVSSEPSGCTAGGQTITCTKDSLAAKDSATWTIRVRVKPDTPDGTTIANIGNAKSADDTTGADSNNVDILVTTRSDLALTKTLNGTLVAGNNAAYTLDVTNNGPSDETGVTVSDTLLAGLTFVSATGATCEASGQTVTCDVGALASGASTSIILTVKVAASATGSVTNTAEVTGTNTDPSPGNNTATSTDPITSDVNLSITKSVKVA